MARRRGKGRFDSEEEDPMAGTCRFACISSACLEYAKRFI